MLSERLSLIDYRNIKKSAAKPHFFCMFKKKAVPLHNFLNDIHNKDYSVVKTFRVGRKSRPFCFEMQISRLN